MSARLRVVTAMLVLYVVWGTTYLGIKVGVDAGLPPALFSGMRLVPAALIMFAWAKFRGARIRLPWRDVRIVSTIGLLLLAGGQYSMMIAEQYIASGIAALIVALNPLWIALAESVFPDMRRPGKLGWLGLAIGFSGLAILLSPRLADVTGGASEIRGIVIVVLGTWMWTAGSIYGKRSAVNADALAITAWEMLAAGLATLAIGTALGEWSKVHFEPRSVGALAYLIVFGSCIAFTAFVYALAHLPASKVMTYAYVNPVIAVFAGWAAGKVGLVPAEPIKAATLIGMVVIAGGVALTTAAPTLPPRRATSASDFVEAEPSDS